MKSARWLVLLATIAWACDVPAPRPTRPPGSQPTAPTAPVPAGRVCGGPNGVSCPSNQVCDQDPGQCSDAGHAGRCVPRPRACTKIYAPVCGCDGTTYSNDCMRVAAGVQKASAGPCAGKR